MKSLLSKAHCKWWTSFSRRGKWKRSSIDLATDLVMQKIGYWVQTLEGTQKRVNMCRQAWEHSSWWTYIGIVMYFLMFSVNQLLTFHTHNLSTCTQIRQPTITVCKHCKHLVTSLTAAWLECGILCNVEFNSFSACSCVFSGTALDFKYACNHI